MINCNAAIFVRSQDVVVVDAHSKPSAAASLIGQIKREITTKPVRYVINTHFHWDHTQGNHAYRLTGETVDFIASAATKELMENLAIARMKASVGAVPQQIDTLRSQAARSSSAAEKAFCADQVRQLEAYQAELKDYTLELPTITFDKSYLLQDPAHDLHIEFHGCLLPASAHDRHRGRDSWLSALHRGWLSPDLAGHDRLHRPRRLQLHHARPCRAANGPHSDDQHAQLHRGINRES
jgi:hypothetical protein